MQPCHGCDSDSNSDLGVFLFLIFAKTKRFCISRQTNQCVAKKTAVFFPTLTNPKQHLKAPVLQHQDFQRERISAILPGWIIQTPDEEDKTSPLNKETVERKEKRLGVIPAGILQSMVFLCAYVRMKVIPSAVRN